MKWSFENSIDAFDCSVNIEVLDSDLPEKSEEDREDFEAIMHCFALGIMAYFAAYRDMEFFYLGKPYEELRMLLKEHAKHFGGLLDLEHCKIKLKPKKEKPCSK